MCSNMVDGQGLEPRMPEAPDLQSGAVTCSARHPLEVRVGFEPTALGICSPLHWATLPPHYGAGKENRTPSISLEG